MTHHWPVRASVSSPSLAVSKPPYPYGRPRSSGYGHQPVPGLAIDRKRREDGGKKANNVLRCSGTPRISGKLFTGLSVGRTAALCIIVIQTHAHTPATRWAHSPRPRLCAKKPPQKHEAVVEACFRSNLRFQVFLYSQGDARAAPSRAVPSCFGVWSRQAARSIQRRRGGGGLTSTRHRLTGSQ